MGSTVLSTLAFHPHDNPTISILQMRKLKHREVKRTSSQDLAPESVLLANTLTVWQREENQGLRSEDLKFSALSPTGCGTWGKLPHFSEPIFQAIKWKYQPSSFGRYGGGPDDIACLAVLNTVSLAQLGKRLNWTYSMVFFNVYGWS